MAQEKKEGNKYKKHPENSFGRYDGTTLTYVTSKSSRNSSTYKHWVEQRRSLLEIVEYLPVWSAACFLSRLMYDIYGMPKNKFNVTSDERGKKALAIISRIPHYMDKYIIYESIRHLNLSCALEQLINNKINKKQVLFKGLLQAVVARILVEDWDSKLANFGCYQIDNTALEVGAFDFEFALSMMKGDFIKEWTFAEIRDIILGGKKGNVANALLETIFPLGTRTTDYYYNMNKEYYNTQQGVNSQQRGIDFLTPSLLYELSNIDPNNHSMALIKLFRDTIKKLRENEEKAREKTKKDTAPKVIEVMKTCSGDAYNNIKIILSDEGCKKTFLGILELNDEEVNSILNTNYIDIPQKLAELAERAIDNASKRLLQSLEKFEKYLDTIEKEILAKQGQQRHGNINCYNPHKPPLGSFAHMVAAESKSEVVARGVGKS